LSNSESRESSAGHVNEGLNQNLDDRDKENRRNFPPQNRLFLKTKKNQRSLDDFFFSLFFFFDFPETEQTNGIY
jgi:hypothetical protein